MPYYHLLRIAQSNKAMQPTANLRCFHARELNGFEVVYAAVDGGRYAASHCENLMQFILSWHKIKAELGGKLCQLKSKS